MTATSLITLAVAILSLVGVVTVGYLTFRGGKFAITQGIQANTETRSEVWNAGYRTAAEEHLQYDADRVADIRQLQSIVNRLEIAAGDKPTKFEPIPKAPPLFPKLEVGM